MSILTQRETNICFTLFPDLVFLFAHLITAVVQSLLAPGGLLGILVTPTQPENSDLTVSGFWKIGPLILQRFSVI